MEGIVEGIVFAALKSLKNFPHSLIEYYDPFKTKPYISE